MAFIGLEESTLSAWAVAKASRTATEWPPPFPVMVVLESSWAIQYEPQVDQIDFSS
jgi:hypothetical protein